MNRPVFSLSVLSGALLFSAPAFAQAEAADRDTIFVTASRLPARADAETIATTVLDEADLERRQTVYVVDALATLPGVSVSRNGAFGGQASVRIRGAASEQTLVLIDGVAVNDPTSPGGGFNAAFLDAADIDRIEVLRGPQSTLWGSDAIGGVVSITTRRPGDGIGGRAFGEAGSYGTVRAGGSTAYGGRVFDGRIGASYVATDGISKADERDGNTERDDYDSTTVDARGGWTAASNLRIDAFGHYANNSNDFDSFGAATGVRDGDEVGKTTERRGGVHARLGLWDGQFENLLTASRAEIERRNFTNRVQSFAADGKRDALRYQGTLTPADWLTAVFGAETETSKIEGSRSTRIDGQFLLAELRTLRGLTLTGGLRRDDHSHFGDVTTSRLGFRWSPAQTFAVRASWGEGFKAPTIFQLTTFFPPATAPTADLQPEEAEGWDAALVSEAFGGKLSAEIGVFSLRTDNLINFSGGRFVNIARAKSEGVEAAASLEPTPGLRLSISYTYNDAIDETTGRPLPRVPDNAAFLEADWQAAERLGLSLTVRYNGKESDAIRLRNPDGVIPDWTRIDLAARYRIGEHAELFGRIENLADQAYQDIFGFGEPGRSVYAGVRVKLE